MIELFPSKDNRDEIEFLLISTITDRDQMRLKHMNIIKKYPRIIDYEGEMVRYYNLY